MFLWVEAPLGASGGQNKGSGCRLQVLFLCSVIHGMFLQAGALWAEIIQTVDVLCVVQSS